MNTTSIMTWIKNNIWLTVIIAVGALALLFPREVKKLFGATRHRRRLGPIRTARRRLRIARRRRSVSYGAKRYLRSVRTTPRKRRTGPKRAWQVKGSIAARRHMAQIRRLRRA